MQALERTSGSPLTLQARNAGTDKRIMPIAPEWVPDAPERGIGTTGPRKRRSAEGDQAIGSRTLALQPKVEPVLPTTRPRGDFFLALAKWECSVLAVSEDTFLARLADIKGDQPEEEAEFFTDDLSEDDKRLLAPGAVFYWSIGYRVTPRGQKSKVSLIKFRRLPAWSTKELAEVERRTQELIDRFG